MTAVTATDAPTAAPTEPKRSRRAREMSSLAGWTVLGWVVGIGFFIPVLWMVITAFKPESAAETWPPKFTFSPTLSEFRTVFSGMDPFIEHSAIATVGSTIVVLVLALPAAYALSIRPVGKWRDSLFFFISTKMLPVVAAIGPLYVIALKTHLLDSLWLLIILYAAMNLPLAIWMIRSFMLEVPTEMLEAARLDGAGRFREITEVIMPVVSPGLVSTALICGPVHRAPERGGHGRLRPGDHCGLDRAALARPRTLDGGNQVNYSSERSRASRRSCHGRS
ncbi:MAG: carbohydrate ABC transporter permease [Trebonia sp.]